MSDSTVTDTPELNLADFEFVRMPNGTVQAVPKSDISDANAPVVEVEREVFAHLADGEVVTVKASELPPSAGTNAPLGFLVSPKDGKQRAVISVYDVV